MDSLALLISPLGFWNLFTLRLRHVHEEGEEFAGGDFIDKTTGIDDKELKRLVELCLWTQSDNLFAKSGRSFSNKKAFFEKADKTTQRYVSSQVDQRITEAVAIAARIGVHVFFAPKPGEWLKQQNELHFDAEPLKLHAAFTKTDDGIDYRLTLGDAIIPSKHRAQVLCNNPSLFVIDHSLRQLDEGLGGKLLTPFLKKKSTYPGLHPGKVFSPVHPEDRQEDRHLLRRLRCRQSASTGQGGADTTSRYQRTLFP